MQLAELHMHVNKTEMIGIIFYIEIGKSYVSSCVHCVTHLTCAVLVRVVFK